MPINYNDWFYKYHQYDIGERNGIKSYNDTKWHNINDRIQNLVKSNSELFAQQPYAIVGNNYGFDQLLNLIQETDYSFDDITDAMNETYSISMKNAMSRMVVNTHAVMFSCKSSDKEHIHYDGPSNYYIIDVPYDQMHFGERDEFIRQYLSKMHTKENNYFMPLNEVVSNEISKVLGFSIIISLNGCMCNDCMIAFDDKGMRFKFKWVKPTQFNCIVYKLDTSHVYRFDVPLLIEPNTNSIVVQWNKMNANPIFEDDVKLQCIVDIYDKNFTTSTNVVPNFGYVDKAGLHIDHIQSYTKEKLNEFKTQTVSFIVYELKYFHEVPNVYPAVNYFNMLEQQNVHVSNTGEDVSVNGDKVSAHKYGTDKHVDICTPPIVIDRDTTITHSSLLNVINDMNSYKDIAVQINSFGTFLNTVSSKEDLTYETKESIIKMYEYVKSSLSNYVKLAALSSMIDEGLINTFQKIYDDVYRVYSSMNSDIIASLRPDTFYDNYYSRMMDRVYAPLKREEFDVFNDLFGLTVNFNINADNSGRFNRPVSEQCFIVLKYKRELKSWVFDFPSIRHFNGIQNSFYINSDLSGNEIYKFFVLYTDTEDPHDKYIEPLTEDIVYDFDLFCQEILKHKSYIRYWSAENKLMRISKILFNEYNAEDCVHILSKMLKGDLDRSMIKEYESNVNFEASGISSLGEGNEDSLIAPFTINYLFYTLDLVYNSNDQLLSYFTYRLTHDNLKNRYTDIDVRKAMDECHTSNINYSKFYTSPNSIQSSHSSLAPGLSMYYGLPIIAETSGVNRLQTYRFTFNDYQDEVYYPSIIDNEIDEDYYARYSDITLSQCVPHIYHDDIEACRIITHFMCAVYDYMSELLTNYKKTFNQSLMIDLFIYRINEYKRQIDEFRSVERVLTPDTELILDTYFGEFYPENVGLINSLKSVKYNIDSLVKNININGRIVSLFVFIEDFISVMKYIHDMFGYKDIVEPRARKLYMYLKHIQDPMTLYEFSQWVNNIDYDFIVNIERYIAPNENYQPINMSGYISAFNNIRTSYPTIIETLKDAYNELITEFNIQNTALNSFCDTIVNQYIFDMYTLNDVEFTSGEYNSKPVFVTAQISSESHSTDPVSNETMNGAYILLVPEVQYSNNKYTITALNKIAEYTFFNGEDLNVTLNVLDSSMVSLGTISTTLHFTKISSSADNYESFSQLSNIENLKVDILNIHESFTVENNVIVDKRFADLNYELYIQNRYKQLKYESELILDPINYTPGAIDRMYISNQYVNNVINQSFGNHVSTATYFKPCQVLHLSTDDDKVLESVGGKYHVGQRIYLQVEENDYTFPIIITAIDHNQAKGFIEAVVDDENSKWFKIDDPVRFSKYLNNTITCHTLPDNVSNFLTEYNDVNLSSYDVLSIPSLPEKDFYEFPGDPIFVQNNSEYVYTRLNWMIDDNVRNRFIDEEHKKYHFTYLGDYQCDGEMRINMINHKLNTLSLSQQYPILRQEPNDYDIWDLEIETFNQSINTAQHKVSTYTTLLARYTEEYKNAKTKYAKRRIKRLIEATTYDLQYWESYIKRVTRYKENLENPTTWYNLNIYEAAFIYIINGRAKTLTPTFGEFVTDIPYTSDVDLYMYDYDNKRWVSPDDYSVTTHIEDGVTFNNPDDFVTNTVMHSITITFNDPTYSSRKLLVYIGFDKSNIYEDITLNDDECEVQFKPVLTIDREINTNDMYGDINVRKHYDCYEKYVFNESNTEFGGVEITRPKIDGTYVNAPVSRFHDLEMNDLSYLGYDVYIPMTFKDVSTQETSDSNTYQIEVNVDVDDYTTNTIMNAICVESDRYNGNISSLMFEVKSGNDPDNQSFTVISATRQHLEPGDYICSISLSSAYKSCGGLITISVLQDNHTDIIRDNWIKLNNPEYHIIPDHFILTPKVSMSYPITVIINNNYEKDYVYQIYPNNDSYANPFLYYYDTNKDVRYPISDTHHSNPNKRLVIDKTNNPSVKVVRSTFIGICRYSLSRIPQDGIIDVTGYIPTPLSRDRYEFWVNGRCIKNKNDLHIISPNTIQLCNLKSLRNFELIELVDDRFDSSLLPKGNVYVDMNGNYYYTNTYESFIRLMVNNQNVVDQSIRYIHFNRSFDYDYAVKKSNNVDVEPDILDGLIFDESSNYKELFNLPSLNGVTLYNLSTKDIGIQEVDNKKILDLYDKTWKIEAITNPFIPLRHTSNLDEKLVIHCKHNESTETFDIMTYGEYDGFFTLYLSDSISASISDIEHTKKIIPFVRTGVMIRIDESYEGLFIHNTSNNEIQKIK